MNQDKEVQLEPRELEDAMRSEFQQLLRQTADALNKARDGAIIADSEWVVREAMARFRRKVYEKALQMKADKAADRRRPSARRCRIGSRAAGCDGTFPTPRLWPLLRAWNKVTH